MKGDNGGGVIDADPAQPPIEGSIITKAPGGGERIPGVTSEHFEFDVEPGYDNAKLRGVVTPTLPSDLDLYLERLGDDGSWTEVASGTSSALDGETIGAEAPIPGHYRLEVHNWAGPPGNQSAIKLTFLNSASEPGT